MRTGGSRGSEIFSGKLAEPSAVIVWIGGATVVAVFALLLAGVAASFVYQHHLPPLPSRRSAAQLPIGKLLAAMRSKRRRAGLALQAAGALLLLGCLAPGLLTLAAPRTIGDLFVSGEGMIAYLVAFAPMVIGAYAAFARGKRLAAEALLVARRRDQRPPILFLRSFGDDRRPIRRALPLSRMQPSDFFRGVWTLEEALERDLARLGSVVAIGRPGEELPPAGAAREYVADDVWKDRVTELLDGAALVAVVAGETEGLALEYRTIAARGALSRLVLILPDPRPVQHLKQVDALLRGDTSPVARHFTGGSSMSPYGRIP